MTLQSIKNYLPRAFMRIEKSSRVREKQYQQEIKTILGDELGGTSEIEFRRGVIKVFSSSATLKHKLLLSKKNIIETLNKRLPHLGVKDIYFTGPK